MRRSWRASWRRLLARRLRGWALALDPFDCDGDDPLLPPGEALRYLESFAASLPKRDPNEPTGSELWSAAAQRRLEKMRP